MSLGPFPGVRYAAEVPLERVLAPPYDVVERDEALALARADEHNVVRLVLPEGVDPAAAAAATLTDWLDQGVLRVDDEAGLYVYEQADADGEARQRGLIGALALTGPDSRAVLPHEDVMPGPVEDRTRLMAATSANLEPIWLLYRGAAGAASTVVETVAARGCAAGRGADRGRHATPALGGHGRRDTGVRGRRPGRTSGTDRGRAPPACGVPAGAGRAPCRRGRGRPVGPRPGAARRPRHPPAGTRRDPPPRRWADRRRRCGRTRSTASPSTTHPTHGRGETSWRTHRPVPWCSSIRRVRRGCCG